MMNTKYTTIEEMMSKIQCSKSETFLNLVWDFSEFHDQMTYLGEVGHFHFEGDLLSENAGSEAMTLHEAWFLTKIL